MSDVLDRIVARIAPRLAAMLAESDAALIHGPHEFRPVEIVETALDSIGGAYRRHRVTSVEDVAVLRRSLPGRRPVLVEWLGEDPETGAALERLMVEAMAPGALATPVIAVAEVDADPLDGRLGGFELKIGPTGLLVTEADLEAIAPAVASDVVWRREILGATGGVPVLLAAALEDLGVVDDVARPVHPPREGSLNAVAARRAMARRGTEGGESRLVVAARQWATRAFQSVRNEPLRLMHAWIAPLPERTMAAVTSEVLAREVTVAQVREAREYSAIFSVGSGDPSFPPALAAELIRLAVAADARKASRLRRTIAQVAASPEVPVSALDRISITTSLGAWGVLDQVLAAEMPSLVLLTDRQRHVLASLWPTQVPADEWPHLAAARDWLAGRELPPDLPVPWVDLLHLLSQADADLISPEFVDLRDRLVAGVSTVHGATTEGIREALADGARWLATRAASAHDEATRAFDLSPRFSDELALLAFALMGAADGCLSKASIADAQACVNRAQSLCEMADVDVDRAPALRIGLTARSALLATIAGVNDRARSQIGLYENQVRHVGARDGEPEHLVHIARRYCADSTPRFSLASTEIDINTGFTPYELEAEALVLLLQHGPITAAQWVQAFLGRSRWTDSHDFEWWPLHAMLALLDVREGRNQAAQRWLDGGTIPTELSLVIQAGIELNLDHLESAQNLVARMTEMPTSLDRWRLLAHGIRAGALNRADPTRTPDTLLHLREWQDSLATLALLPAVCRETVLSSLDPTLASLPGLTIEGPAEPGPARDVVLTPRQQDVLHGLVGGGTLGQIADDLFLGVETVRSTAKALYKRLGVHDRASAVQVARSMGLLK